MQIVNKLIKELKPYEKNPRKNNEAVEYVANSIKEFGFKVPIIIDKDDVIVAGHTRYKAAKRLKMKEVPCIVADDLTEEQIKAFRIADNKVGEIAQWDDELLTEELSNIFNLDMSDFGFDFGEEEYLDNKEIVEIDIPELPVKPKSKYGEIYKLGNHYLMCGDSTNERDVDKLMNNQQADLLFTDPPYNVNVSNSEGMTIENDNLESHKFGEFLHKSFYNADKYLKFGGSFYIWYADSEAINFRQACEDNNLSVRQCLIWVKNSFNFGRQDYKWQHEPCLYGWKEGAAHYFIEEFNHSTVMEDKLDLDKMKKEELKATLKEILDNKIPTTVIHEDKPIKNDLHPTMKPLRMCGSMIRNSSIKGDIVLDLFGGSGSTLMVCEQLNRTCYMMEYDPKYVDVIIKRWEDFTGKKAVLIKQ